nr:SLC13 family permease [Actinomyces ruminis]
MPARTRPAVNRPRPGAPDRLEPLNRRQIIGIVIGVAVFVAPLLVDVPDLDPLGERMLSIFLLAIVFWVSEAIPLVATAVLVIGLEVLLISDQAVLPVPEDATAYSSFLAALANPVIVLFLGGFLIADGAEKFHLDKNLAAVLIKPFTGSARRTVLGLMVITAVLSMFMSNTATTATMFAVVIPVLGALPEAGPAPDWHCPFRWRRTWAAWARPWAHPPTPSPWAPWPRPATPSASWTGCSWPSR